MNYRSFGKADLKVSEIGLCCASLGGGLYYKDDQESIKTLLKAFDSGINFYDTSDVHSQGNAQRLVGQAFRSKRDRVVIASKTGVVLSNLGSLASQMRPLVRPVSRFLRPMKRFLHQMRASQRYFDFSAQYLTKVIDRSLKLLQTDYLDLFQLYKPPTSLLEKGDFCETLDSLKTQGKIRYYGVTCATADDALISLKHSGISSVQINLNLLDQEAIAKLLPLSVEKQIAVIANHPRAMGLLTNAHSDIMSDTSLYDQREFEERRARAKKFQFLIKKDRTLAQASIQFVLQLKGVSVAIPRAVNREQLEENLSALTASPLRNEELMKIYSMNS
jgi:aryl-alcohol dehydrogenase-like predicted oxidoreductase